MTAYTEPTNSAGNGALTTNDHGDRGDGVDSWFSNTRTWDGGDVAQGSLDDAADVDHTSVVGTVIARLKGIIQLLRSLPNGYPYSATPVIVGSGNVANASAAATMAAVASKTNYLAGIIVTGAGATAASVVALTITGLLGGTRTQNIVVPAGVTTSIVPYNFSFYPPLPASAANTAIVVTAAAFGAGNTNAAVMAHGYVV